MKVYRIDIPAYEAWLSAQNLGSCAFTADDLVTVDSLGGKWAYNVDCLFVSVGKMPARFLIPVEA